MNKDEMIEEMKIAISNALGLRYEGNNLARRLVDAGYRKVAEDEIVESMKTYERARQETAREILQELYYEATSNVSEIVKLTTFQIEQLANKYGIELE